MLVCFSLQFIHNFIIFCCSFLSSNYFFWTTDVQQIICCFYRLKSMSYHYDCQLTSLFSFYFLNIFDCILNFHFTFWIEGRCSFIKYQYFWSFNQSSCNRDSLFLSTWQIIKRRGPNVSIYSILQCLNELSVCFIQCNFNIFVRSSLICKFHVFLNCSKNQNRFLWNVSDWISKLRK